MYTINIIRHVLGNLRHGRKQETISCPCSRGEYWLLPPSHHLTFGHHPGLPTSHRCGCRLNPESLTGSKGLSLDFLWNYHRCDYGVFGPIAHSRMFGTSSRRCPQDLYLSHPRPAHQCPQWTQASKSDLCSETEEVARLGRGCGCHASLLRSATPQIKLSEASVEIRAILRPLFQRGFFSLILPILLSLAKTKLFFRLFSNVFSKKSCRLWA